MTAKKADAAARPLYIINMQHLDEKGEWYQHTSITKKCSAEEARECALKQLASHRNMDPSCGGLIDAKRAKYRVRVRLVEVIKDEVIE